VSKQVFVLSAGMTGLAAGFASGLPVFEAAAEPGGICSSYYMQPGHSQRLSKIPKDGEAYRFEIGGGHWIFGGNSSISHFLKRFVALKEYHRRSAIYLKGQDLFVPYPIQNHLSYLDKKIATQALVEMNSQEGSNQTMKQWLKKSFGEILCGLFFYPFHDFYTAGLFDRIAPQDAYKSPVDLNAAIQGALSGTQPVGYNATFVYPKEGLNVLAQRIGDSADIRYDKRINKIDLKGRQLFFEDGATQSYDKLISTLPLNEVLQMSGLAAGNQSDPYTSVLVLNIGALRADRCPDDHWIYIPESSSGFHRVGFYSNVDSEFLPASSHKDGKRVGIYVERAFPGGLRPTAQQSKQYAEDVVEELQDWGFIADPEVVDSTWIEVAYTWSWPGSTWKSVAIEKLKDANVFQVGRYAGWRFQGIAASIRDGLLMGSALKAIV